MRIKEILLCSIILLSSARVTAQDAAPGYHLDHYTDDNGLPQNSVKNIAVDEMGFIWLATEAGLTRFNGQRFQTFNKTISGFKSTWYAGFLSDIYGDPNTFYAIGDEETFKIHNGIAIPDSIYQNQSVDKLARFKRVEGQHTFALGLPNVHIEISGFPFYYMITGKGKGRYFIVTKTCVEAYSNNKKIWSYPRNGVNLSRYIHIGNELLYIDDHDNLEKITHLGPSPLKFTGDLIVNTATIKRHGHPIYYWNSVAHQLFLLVKNQLYQAKLLPGNVVETKLILQGFDFDANNIRAVYYDSEHQRIYLGSTTRGLFVLTKKNFSTLLISNLDDHNVMYSQALTDGYILTAQGAFLPYDDSSKTRPANIVVAPLQMRLDQDRRAIFIDKDGNTWVKHGTLLLLFGPDNKKLKRSISMKQEIKTLYQAPDGTIWGHVVDKGLFYIKPDTGYRIQYLKTDSLRATTYIFQEKPDALWIGTFKGAYSVNIKTGKTRIIEGTEKLYVRSINSSLSIPGLLFITSYENGLYLYFNNKVTSVPLDPEKNQAAAHCTIEDKNGYVWMPTNKGLFRFSAKDLQAFAQSGNAPKRSPFYIHYTKNSGFLTNEFNGGCQPCALKLPDGRISLPSLNGLVLFDPEKVKPELPTKPFMVDRIEVNGRTLLHDNSTINLPLNTRRLNMYVATPYFGNVENLRMEYALTMRGEAPEADEWLSLNSADPVIRFSQLGYGDYDLAIRKLQGFGQDNYKIVRLRLIVPPHWYETWLATLLTAFLVALVVYLLVRWRTANLAIQNAELEQRVVLRTENLQNALGALQNSEAALSQQMRFQTKLLASITHDIRTPMRFVIIAGNHLKELITQNELEAAVEASENIAVSATHMSQHLETSIAYIKTQLNGDRVNFQEVLLKPLVNEKLELFSAVTNAHRNLVINLIDEALTIKSNSQLLGIVVQNLIDNANKYTEYGTITIDAERHSGFIHLVITNTGGNFPPAVKDWINSWSEPGAVAGEGSTRNTTGLGLLIIKGLLALIHATMTVETSVDTTIRLVLADEPEKDLASNPISFSETTPSDW